MPDSLHTYPLKIMIGDKSMTKKNILQKFFYENYFDFIQILISYFIGVSLWLESFLIPIFLIVLLIYTVHSKKKKNFLKGDE